MSAPAETVANVEAHHPGARDVVTVQIVGVDEAAVERVGEAGQLLRGACHVMVGGDAPLSPPGVHRLLGELRYLTGRLADLVQHAARDTRTAESRYVLYDSDGRDPGAAIERAHEDLVAAGRAMQELHAQLDAAQTAIATVGHR